MISVVIVTYLSEPELAACVQSLRAAMEELRRTFELVLVDNASGDGTVALARSLAPSGTVIVNARNVGFAKAANQGLAAAQGEVLLLLNPDTIVNGGAIEQCLTRLADPVVGIAAPLLCGEDGRPQRSWHAFPSIRGAFLAAIPPVAIAGAIHRRVSGPPRSPDWLIGAFLMLRRDVFELVGPLTERNFMYAEDMDWCYRVHRAGFRVELLTDSSITHVGGRSAARHFEGTGRDTAVEVATFEWMGRSRTYALLRLAVTIGEGIGLAVVSSLVPGGRRRLRRAIERRTAARRVYAKGLRTKRRGTGAA